MGVCCSVRLSMGLWLFHIEHLEEKLDSQQIAEGVIAAGGQVFNFTHLCVVLLCWLWSVVCVCAVCVRVPMHVCAAFLIGSRGSVFPSDYRAVICAWLHWATRSGPEFCGWEISRLLVTFSHPVLTSWCWGREAQEREERSFLTFRSDLWLLLDAIRMKYIYVLFLLTLYSQRLTHFILFLYKIRIWLLCWNPGLGHCSPIRRKPVRLCLGRGLLGAWALSGPDPCWTQVFVSGLLLYGPVPCELFFWTISVLGGKHMNLCEVETLFLFPLVAHLITSWEVI